MTRQSSSLTRELVKLATKGVVHLVNEQRRNRSGEPYDYVQFNLPAAMPAFPDPRSLIQQRLFGRSALSLYSFGQALEQLAEKPHVKGILLNLPTFAMPQADLQTLHDALSRFRAQGKRVIAYAQMYDLKSYFLASAADEIWLQEGGAFMATGLISQQVFLRDALDTIGVTADVVAISPYKSAADQLSRSEPSEESAAQLNWLLDSLFDTYVSAIAAGRSLSTDDARAMIDRAPLTDLEAQALGYVDRVTRQELFHQHLGDDVKLIMWEEAERRLPIKVSFDEEQIVVLALSGVIVNGTSATPPVDIPIPLVGGPRIGDVTAVNQIRDLMTNEKVKAVVVYIDSQGGSATASEAIHSALSELAKTRPVVAVMGDIAASGGYYIATPAHHIIAQPGTLTGSIGVVLAKLVTDDLLRKLRFNPFTYLRGANADIFASVAPFSEAQRERMRANIERIYSLFLERVQAARKLTREQLEPIAGGRVWTGKQALDLGLVDELGGLDAGIAKARRLAHLPSTAPVLLYLRGPRQPLVAQVAEKVNPAAALHYWTTTLQHLTSGQALYLVDHEWE
ncbi:signal peptide peptidase SppA [Aggregatilineales bacterium SYSU G02658]